MIDDDEICEDCGRSMISWRGEALPVFCESCQADWERLAKSDGGVLIGYDSFTNLPEERG